MYSVIEKTIKFALKRGKSTVFNGYK